MVFFVFGCVFGSNSHLRVNHYNSKLHYLYFRFIILETGTETSDLLRIFRRDKWFAKQPQKQLDRLDLPNHVIIAHTVYSDTRVRMCDH